MGFKVSQKYNGLEKSKGTFCFFVHIRCILMQQMTIVPLTGTVIFHNPEELPFLDYGESTELLFVILMYQQQCVCK